MDKDQVIVAPNVRELEKLAGDLAAWMGKQMPEARNIAITNLSYPFGAGRSHETILFDASWTEDGRKAGGGFVVRIKPSNHLYYPDDLFDEQIRLMQILHRLGQVKVAKVFWHETDASILGQPFFVMEKKQGRVAVSTPPYAKSGWVADATPAQRAKMWEAGVRQLAAIAATPLDDMGFLAGKDGLSGLAQEWDKYARFLEWVSVDHRWPLLERRMDDLKRRWPKHQPQGIVWGDARIGNMMIGSDFDVVCVMDWEQPSLGGAMHDLGWWTWMDESNHGGRRGGERLAGMGSLEETLCLWSEASGIPLDDFDWYAEFTGVKIALLSIRTAQFRGQPEPTDQTFERQIDFLRR